MLPILYKFEFDTFFMKGALILSALLLTAYGAFSGWRGAGPDAPTNVRRLRAVVFGAFSGILSCVAAVYGAPRFSEGAELLVKLVVWGLSAVMVVASVAYGRAEAPKGEAGTTGATYGALATGAAFFSIKYGLAQPLGRNLGAPLHTYGLLIATAFIAAIWVLSREAARGFPGPYVVDGRVQKDDAEAPIALGSVMRDHMLDLGFYILVSAMVGSRVLFVIVNWKDYRSDLTQIFSVSGGLVFYGGFIGATLTSIWYCRRNRLPFLRIADIAIPSVSLGHMIGRMGCLAAGCCWGDIAKAGSRIAIRFPAAKHLPFGGFHTDSLAFQDQLKDHRWVDGQGHILDHAVEGAQQISAYAQANGYSMPVYPTQVMESCGELVLFVLLLAARRRKRFHGQILGMWLIGYAMLRTTVELFRGDLARGYVFRWPTVDPILLSTSQTISLAMFALGVCVFVLQGRKGRAGLHPAVPA